MSKNLRSASPLPKELLKLSPLVLYEIATDIQVSENWKKFAFSVGFSAENVIMIEMTSGDRFPAENVMYHWFSKNPKVDDLARILFDLNLEKSLYRLKAYVPPEAFRKFQQRFQKRKQEYEVQENSLKYYDDVDQSNVTNDQDFQTQLSNISSTTSGTSASSMPTTPEPGLINITLLDSPTSRSGPLQVSEEKLLKQNDKNEEDKCKWYIFESTLNKVSTKFSIDEFSEDFFDKSSEGKLSVSFHKKLRGNMFYIQSYSLKKISESQKNQTKLYNVIWSLLHFRLSSLPILTGYCFLENHLFLIYPYHNMRSLFDILHRPHCNNNVIISVKERLMILRIVGEALSFLHSSIPFGACHGQVNSGNVLVGPNVTLLSGFDKFYTEDVDYLKGLENFSKSKAKIEKYYRRDVLGYLELICETMWNVHPYKNISDNECLVNDINQGIIVPKMKYPGWQIEIHTEIKNLIHKYTSSKNFPKIEEIVDDLMKTDSSFEPPSYNDIELFDSLK